jgi:sterol desaturase/sphingolipid hydroxylase (fatty acid hydroxylase superfamily)
MNFALSVLVLSGFYVAVSFVERRPAVRFRILPKVRPYLGTDVAWYGVAVLASAVSVFVFRPQLAKLAVAPVARVVEAMPGALRFVLALLVFDLVSFLVHVGLHRSDRLWSVHKVHHSSLQLDALATTRTHMFENLARFVPAQAVLFLIGMPAAVVAPAVAVAAAFGVSNHSNVGLDLGWAERLFVTPRLHRRHHVPATTQHNYGTMFTIWDRLFGTLLQLDTTPDERFGVPGEIDSYPQRFGPAFRQPLLEVRSARSSAAVPSR